MKKICLFTLMVWLGFVCFITHINADDTLCTTTPGAVSLTAPSGTTTDTTPNFTWVPDDCSTWYQLYLADTAGTYKFVQWYELEDNSPNYPEAACSDGICTISFSEPLSSGDYQWWIRTWNEHGNGEWSSMGTFTADAGTPGKIVLTSPDDQIDATTPTFTWKSDDNATWYRLFVQENGNKNNKFSQWYEITDNSPAFPEATCSGGNCSVDLADTFSAGTYTWWVLGWNVNGSGDWSDGMGFTVVQETALPAKIVLSTPYGTIDGTAPTFTWKSDDNATWYRLFVQENGNKNNKFSQWYEITDNSPAFPEATCSGGNCSVDLADTFSAGTYTWWVVGWNDGGDGDWSDGKTFTVEAKTSSDLAQEIETYMDMISSVGDLTPMVSEIGIFLEEIMNGDDTIVHIDQDLENLSLTNLPEEINIEVDFGDAYTPEGSSSVYTGELVINITNLRLVLEGSSPGITANAQMTATNVKRDDQLILDGGMSLGVNMGIAETITVVADIDFSELTSLDFQVNGGISLTVPTLSMEDGLTEPVTITFEDFTTTDFHVSGTVNLTQINEDSFDALFNLTTNQGNVAGTVRITGTDDDQVIVSTPSNPMTAGGYTVQINDVTMDPEVCQDMPTAGNIVITGDSETKTISYSSNCTYTVN